MKKFFISGIVPFFFLLSIFIFPTDVCAENIETPSLDNALAVCLYNIENEKIIVSKSENDKIYPASTAKIMTGILAIEHLGEKLDDKITVTEKMLSTVSGKNMGLKSGESIKIKDLLYGALCGGNNDAATVLAFAVSDSLSDFVKLMNEKALALGAESTNYTNPTGMHNPQMYTTVSDLLKISLYAYKIPLFMEITSTTKHTINATNLSKSRSIHNRNYMISASYTNEYYYPSVDGINAGATDEGGDCLVTSIRKKDVSYLCIVMGAFAKDIKDDSIYSYIIAQNLIEWAYENYGYVTLAEKGASMMKIPVELSNDVDTIDAVALETVQSFLPINIDKSSELVYSFKASEETLKAPIKAGEPIGYMTVTYKGEILSNIELFAKNDVERSTFLYVLMVLRNYTAGRAFKITLAVAALLAILRIVIPQKRPNNAYRRKRKYF